MAPPRKPYPPLPDPGAPFDLGALDRVRAAPAGERRSRWWRREPRPRPSPTVRLAEPRALLALVPDPHQSDEIRRALRSAGAGYVIPVRITLQTGLAARDDERWGGPVRDVTRRRDPFTVRLVGPEVVADRTLHLRAVGPAVRSLQLELYRALARSDVTLDDPRTELGPVLPLAGTWTDMNRVELHELATGVRNALRTPIEFRATSLYAFEESADDDLPFLDFPLGPG